MLDPMQTMPPHEERESLDLDAPWAIGTSSDIRHAFLAPPLRNQPKLLYTGITRATEQKLVTSGGDRLLKDFNSIFNQPKKD